MAKVKTKKERESELKEIIGEFIIKTDEGYYVGRVSTFDTTEVYSGNIDNAEVFRSNIIATCFMEYLKDSNKKELINLK